jgi:hypothetical protein
MELGKDSDGFKVRSNANEVVGLSQKYNYFLHICHFYGFS